MATLIGDVNVLDIHTKIFHRAGGEHYPEPNKVPFPLHMDPRAKYKLVLFHQPEYLLFINRHSQLLQSHSNCLISKSDKFLKQNLIIILTTRSLVNRYSPHLVCVLGFIPGFPSLRR
jgi:hypothetical protein